MRYIKNITEYLGIFVDITNYEVTHRRIMGRRYTMAIDHVCTEQPRMERLEQKIDKIFEVSTQVQVSVARLENIPGIVSRHEQEITQLKIATEVSKAFATKKEFWIATGVSVAAILISLVPSLARIIAKLLQS